MSRLKSRSAAINLSVGSNSTKAAVKMTRRTWKNGLSPTRRDMDLITSFRRCGERFWGPLMGLGPAGVARQGGLPLYAENRHLSAVKPPAARSFPALERPFAG